LNTTAQYIDEVVNIIKIDWMAGCGKGFNGGDGEKKLGEIGVCFTLIFFVDFLKVYFF
jgi:hypothetical protein